MQHAITNDGIECKLISETCAILRMCSVLLDFSAQTFYSDGGCCSNFINPWVNREVFMNTIKPAKSFTVSINEVVLMRWNMFTAAKNRLASDLKSAPGVLDRLARTLNAQVQQRVAENTSTGRETLELLSHHESSDVRSAVAQNHSTCSSTLDSLSHDASSDVRYAMAEDTRTSTMHLQSLATDENPYVQDRAKRTQSRLAAEKPHTMDQESH